MKCPKCHSENTDTARFCSNCATALGDEVQPSFTKTVETPAEELSTGSVFANRYQVIEELGKGGMGKVYRVLDKKLNEEVALKLIKPEIASDKQTLERFKNELKLARKVAQKNVGKMFDLGEETGTHYITMEYVPGEDLKSFIRRSGQLVIGTAIRITKQICEGLSEAHGIGIIHRDLKPSNIMIDKQGNARIMDFGIARSMEAKKLTGAGVIIGTPEYMSPEQVEGKETDQRSDIYSLGVILYEMLTGRLPFEGDTPLSIAVQHRSDTPKDPSEFNVQIPEDLCVAILKCLEKEKGTRYPSAKELLSSLAQIEQGIPTTEKKASPSKPTTSKEITVQFTLKRVFVPVSIAFAILVVALIIIKPWSGKKIAPIPTDKPSIAVLYFRNNTGDDQLDRLRPIIHEMMTADLLQSTLLYVSPVPRVAGAMERLNLLETVSYSDYELKEITAALGGVNNLVTGSYRRSGDGFVITTFVNKMDSDQPFPLEDEAEDESTIDELVDRLSRRIKDALGFSRAQIAGDIDRDVSRITSHSNEARTYYIEARTRYYAGDMTGAIGLFEKALDADPEFAMAMRGMASAYWALWGYRDKAISLHQKALDRSERLPDRERLQIRGDLESSLGEQDEAVKAFTELLALYPDDTMAIHGLALAYLRMGETDKAIENYKKAIDMKTEFVGTYTQLATIYRRQELNHKAEELFQQYIDEFGDHQRLHRWRADYYLDEGDYDLALNEVNKALDLNPGIPFNILLKGHIHLCMGDFSEAETEVRKMLKEEEIAYQSFGLTKLTDLYTSQGKYQASLEQVMEGLKRVEGVEDKRWILGWISGWLYNSAYIEFASGNLGQALKKVESASEFAVENNRTEDQPLCLRLRGLIYLRMGNFDSAQETADELMQHLEQHDIADTSGHDFLLGSIELMRKNYGRALRLIEKALMNNEGFLLYLYSAALGYFESGEIEQAQEKCEEILSSNPELYALGYPSYFDLRAKSHFLLGKIFEQMGSPGKAIESYEKFLDLWKDADPGLPELDEARNRLNALKGT